MYGSGVFDSSTAGSARLTPIPERRIASYGLEQLKGSDMADIAGMRIGLLQEAQPTALKLNRIIGINRIELVYFSCGCDRSGDVEGQGAGHLLKGFIDVNDPITINQGITFYGQVHSADQYLEFQVKRIKRIRLAADLERIMDGIDI